SFRVSYVSVDPATARTVTERLAALYINQNLKDRETQAESTSQFLSSQLQDAKARLLEQEQKLERYRRAHAGQLPSQLQGNLQAMQNAQLQLQALDETMNRARERRLLIERQIADTEQTPPAPENPDATAGTTAQQLEVAQGRLESFKLRYTPNHPDVIALQRAIADLQKRLAAEAGEGPRAAAEPPSAAEVARQKRILDLKAELEVVDHQLKSGQDEEAQLKKAIGGYQHDISALPTRESELVELTRDYSTLQAAYAALLVKREDSKVAANLERQQIGEQFRVLDPASLPERSFNRLQRIGITASGAIAGLVLGLMSVVFLEFRDSSFHEEEEVTRALTLPVLALVPLITSEAQRRTARRWMLLTDVAGIGVLAATTAVLVLWRLRM